jgi:Protein of unknown function (DUF3237)
MMRDKEHRMELQAIKLLTLHVELDEPRIVGQTPEGKLTIIPIIGGVFEGSGLRGQVCAGGADWNTVSGTHCHVCARYWLETDDGAVISVLNEGWFSFGGNDAAIKTTPHFKCDTESRYAFLNAGTYAGELSGGDKNSVNIVIWKLA